MLPLFPQKRGMNFIYIRYELSLMFILFGNSNEWGGDRGCLEEPLYQLRYKPRPLHILFSPRGIVWCFVSSIVSNRRNTVLLNHCLDLFKVTRFPSVRL